MRLPDARSAGAVLVVVDGDASRKGFGRRVLVAARMLTGATVIADTGNQAVYKRSVSADDVEGVIYVHNREV